MLLLPPYIAFFSLFLLGSKVGLHEGTTAKTEAWTFMEIVRNPLSMKALIV